MVRFVPVPVASASRDTERRDKSARAQERPVATAQKGRIDGLTHLYK